jgi:hypothetical protein
MLAAMVGAVVIIANQYTIDPCEGIQQTYVQWIILSGPQIAQILAFMFVGGVFTFKWCTSSTSTTQPRNTSWDRAKPDVVAQSLLNRVQKPGALTTVSIMVIYCLFAVGAILNYVIDLVVVGTCLSSNETLALVNDTAKDLRGIAGHSAIGIVLIFCTFNFFFFGLALKQFHNTGKLTTAFLGGILVSHVLIWVSSFIQEASEDDDIFKWLKECKNLTIEGNCESERNYFSFWKQWLYSITVEYSLITVSLTLKLWNQENENHVNISELQTMNKEDKRVWHYYSNVGIAIAIFVSLPIIAAYMISSGLTVHWQPGSHESESKISNSANGAISSFLWTNVVTSMFLVICFLVMLVITAHAPKCRTVLALEDYLTIFTGISVQMIAMAIFTSDMFVLSGDKGSPTFPPGSHTRLSSVMAVFDFIQGIFQTLVFIYLKAIRLRTISDNRQRLAIMLCVSIGAGLDLILFFWATVFEGHMSLSIHASQVNVFGNSTWRRFIVPLYPLAIFYRLHCFWAFIRFIEMIRMSTDRKMRYWAELRQKWEQQERDSNGQTQPPGNAT